MREWLRADQLMTFASPEMPRNQQSVKNTWVSVTGWSDALWLVYDEEIRLLRRSAISMYEYAHTRAEIEDMLGEEFGQLFECVSVEIGFYKDGRDADETFGILITAIPYGLIE